MGLTAVGSIAGTGTLLPDIAARIAAFGSGAAAYTAATSPADRGVRITDLTNPATRRKKA